MAFEAYSREQYYIGFHHYFCKGETPKEAAERVGMDKLTLWRAATGYLGSEKGGPGGKRDGLAGREAFLDWMKAFRRGASPCCGAKIVAGPHLLIRLNKAEEHQTVAKLQKRLAELEARLVVETSRAKRAPAPAHDTSTPDEDERDEAR